MSNIVEFIYRLSDQISKPLETIARNNIALVNQTQKTQSMFDGIGKSVLKFAAGYIGIQQVIQKGRAFLSLGIDIEQTRIKFETLTGSLERGNALIEQLSGLAAKSPFSRGQFMGNAETMLAFGIETDKVNGYLGMLGDVAAGDKNKLNGLTLAFSQMHSTGKLTGQDLLQMINAGFNPLNEIAQKTGKSIGQLKDEMSKGSISTQMVIEAFQSATSEGGKFYQMSEKIANMTAGGKAGTAFGILQDKLTGYAEKLQPVMNKAADYFLAFANNFEKFTSAIWAALVPVRALMNGLFSIAKFLNENRTVLVATISVYAAIRVALWSSALALKGWTIASMLQYKWLVLVEGAQKLLNATILKNPFVAAAVGISLIVGALVMMRKRTREASDEYAKLNTKAKEYSANERASLDILFDRLRKTNPKSKERNELVKQLKDMYPDVLKNMNLEKAGLEELEKAYNAIALSIDKKARARAFEDRLVEMYKEKDLLEAEEAKRKTTADSWSSQAEYYAGAELIGEGMQAAAASVAIANSAAQSKYRNAVTARQKKDAEIARLREKMGAENFGGSNTGGDPLITGGGGTGSSNISSLTGSGSKPTNITITFRNLVEQLQLYSQTLPEGVNQVHDELVEGLLRVVNSTNRIAER